MERNLSSSAKLMQGSGSYGGFDLQGSMGVHDQQQHPVALPHLHHHSHPREGSIVHPMIHENFSPTMASVKDSEQTISLGDYMKNERAKCACDEEEPSFTEDDHYDAGKGKKTSPWQRVKWTDVMVRLLITAVSYMNEEAAAEYGVGGRRKYVNLPKKGKWKSVSKVMAERGHFVSPQQCEDKFNDLNKRYKRLNEILGRGTSCEVVENPALLEVMDHIPEKAKEEVRKILSSKHLHYEEMCSYHNGNRLHLPADPELQRSLRLALRSRDDQDCNDVKRQPQDDINEDTHGAELENRDQHEENHVLHGDSRVNGTQGGPSKKIKQYHGHEEASFGNSLHPIDCNRTFDSQPQSVNTDENKVSPEGMKANLLQKQWITHRSLQLEQKKLHIQAEMLHIQAQTLELEKERLEWQTFSRKKDRELEMMQMENERMKLENEHLALELKQKEMGTNYGLPQVYQNL